MKTSKVVAIFSIATLTLQTSAFPQAASIITKLAAGALAGWGLYEIAHPEDVETKIQADVQRKLDQNKQRFFETIHPIGKAREIKVHEVSTRWKKSNPKNLKDLKGYSVVYTIYWSGLLTADGYTKAESYFDADVDRFIQTEVIATNGTTKSQAIGYATVFLTGFIGGLGIH
ncbi:MAG: hypothetical protein NTZ08_14170 [Verrucomicrobia bacterium]|nr:hypothetical protein [Verrucomicrobiota bacterium]